MLIVASSYLFSVPPSRSSSVHIHNIQHKMYNLQYRVGTKKFAETFLIIDFQLLTHIHKLLLRSTHDQVFVKERNRAIVGADQFFVCHVKVQTATLPVGTHNYAGQKHTTGSEGSE